MGEKHILLSDDRGVIRGSFLVGIGLVVGLSVGLALGAVAIGLAGQGSVQGKVRTFVVIPYHWGFAIFDSQGNEIDAIEVQQGEIVELVVMPGAALSHELHERFQEKMAETGIGGLGPGNETVEAIEEAEAMGLMTHTVTIAEFGVNALVIGNTDDPSQAHQVLRFTADRKGAFDVRCIEYCGVGHPWMVLQGGLVIG